MIRRQLVLPAGPARVWEALTDPDEAEAWFGGRIDWGPSEGEPLRFVSTGGEVREGLVETVRPARHLRFRWWPADGDGQASEVAYTLDEDGTTGTILTVQETQVEGTWTARDSLRLQMYAGPSLCAVG